MSSSSDPKPDSVRNCAADQDGGTATERSLLLPKGRPAPTPPIDGDAATATTERSSDEFSTSRLVLMMSGIFVASFLVAMDSTVMATLSAPIAESFDALHLLPWLSSAFFLTTVMSQPLTGRLSEIFGRQIMLLTALSIFGFGNIVCAAAKEKSMFIVGRAIAGLGGGSIGPLFSIIASDLVPLRSRGIWQGLANIAFGIGSSIGAPVGGLFYDSLGWQWAFWIQMPPSILSFLLISIFPTPKKTTHHYSVKSKLDCIDWLGALLLPSALLLLLIVLSLGGTTRPWLDPVIVNSLFASAIMLGLFLCVEQRAVEPIVPIKLLTNRTVLCAYISNWLTTMSRFGLFFHAPIYFLAQGYSTSQAGLVFVPSSLAIGIASFGVGIVVRRTGNYYATYAISGLTFVLALGVSTAFLQVTPLCILYLCFFFVGGCYQGILTTTLLAFTAAIDQKEQALVTSASYIFRNAGSAMGLSIASGIFDNTLRRQLEARFGGDEETRKLIDPLQRSTSVIKDLTGTAKSNAIGAYIVSLRLTFAVLALLGALGVLSGLCMKKHKLHTTLSRRE